MGDLVVVPAQEVAFALDVEKVESDLVEAFVVGGRMEQVHPSGQGHQEETKVSNHNSVNMTTTYNVHQFSPALHLLDDSSFLPETCHPSFLAVAPHENHQT